MLSDLRGSLIAYVGEVDIDVGGPTDSRAVVGPDRRNRYNAFGLMATNNNDSLFAYTGQIFLPEIGLYHYKARAYNPDLGRFMQTDPIGYEDGTNLYAYVGNDPINLSDPTGLIEECGGQIFNCTDNSNFNSRQLPNAASAEEATARVLALQQNGRETRDFVAGVVLAFTPGPDETLLAGFLARRAGILASGIPQGLTRSQFGAVSSILRNSRVASISDDIFIQGSRARGTARADSDLDIGVRVSSDRFDEIIDGLLANANPGSAKARTLVEARDRGRIFAGEAGFRGVRNQIRREIGRDVDLSIIRQGGLFDRGPFVPVP